jgi:hypothetical protein
MTGMAMALLGAARGVSHLMARDRDGTWTEVTDPAIMAKVLNSGELFYRLYARNPDVKALKDLRSPVRDVDSRVVRAASSDDQQRRTKNDAGERRAARATARTPILPSPVAATAVSYPLACAISTTRGLWTVRVTQKPSQYSGD